MVELLRGVRHRMPTRLLSAVYESWAALQAKPGEPACAAMHKIAELARETETRPLQEQRRDKTEVGAARRYLAWRSAEARDDATNDLLVSDVIRSNELQVWFTAGHVARRTAAASGVNSNGNSPTTSG